MDNFEKIIYNNFLEVSKKINNKPVKYRKNFDNFPYKNFLYAEINNPSNYKVLSTDNKKLSINNRIKGKMYKRKPSDSQIDPKKMQLIMKLSQMEGVGVRVQNHRRHKLPIVADHLEH